MKYILTLIVAFTSLTALAQEPKLITEGYIHSKMNIIMPEEGDNIANVQGGEGGGGMMRFGGDMEFKTSITIKGAMMRTDTKSDFGTMSFIRDGQKKINYILRSMMGQKTAYYGTDEEQAISAKKRDSALRANGVNIDTSQRKRQKTEAAIIYTEEEKKINGYNCKKAYIVHTNIFGIKDSSVVWYNPAVKISEDIRSQISGSTRGGGMRMNMEIQGLEKLNGLPMQYEMKNQRGIRTVFEVTKIEAEKKVDDSAFEVPKGYELKPMSEMSNMFGGGRGMRIEVRQ